MTCGKAIAMTEFLTARRAIEAERRADRC